MGYLHTLTVAETDIGFEPHFFCNKRHSSEEPHLVFDVFETDEIKSARTKIVRVPSTTDAAFVPVRGIDQDSGTVVGTPRACTNKDGENARDGAPFFFGCFTERGKFLFHHRPIFFWNGIFFSTVNDSFRETAPPFAFKLCLYNDRDLMGSCTERKAICFS